jgi:integrase
MLKLYRRKRDKNWRIRGTLFGRKLEESTETADRTQAEILLNARVAEITRHHVQGAVLGRRPAPTFAGAVVIYVENGGERRFLAPLLKQFGARPIDEILQEDIDDAARRLLPGRAPATLNRQIYAPMSAVLKAAGVHTKIRRRKEAERPPRWLTAAEAKRLVDACNPSLRPLVTFLLYTGSRVGEALWLDWACVDLLRGHVAFPRTKNGEPRGLPLHPEAIAALGNLPHRSGEIFRRPDGLPYARPSEDDDDDTSAGRRISNAFKGACRRAGIVNFRPHDCRHTWATWHYQTHRDLLALKEAGGWRSERMVARYAHVNREHLRPQIEALPRLENG